ncbi:ABC transporter substrate-binding protein [Azospirillum sp.]|uniref:ABC transporter substrate-binding protein n=1 Tax=Azospirillum sp. TaxID=34012 RepID=UPI002D6E7BBF|nr:ABC transporter substrate-binding protein [Azospirillum sp.]HYD70082.1 ABC transporter substrate-binding protein [Azospirillum sp.]
MKRRAFAAMAMLAGCAFAGAPALAQTAGGTFRIGLIDDMSGVYADITGQGSVTAARLAVEDFGGSVLGRKIELLTADHQNKADIASSTARGWYDAQDVKMITGLGNSAVALAVRALSRERGKVDIVSGAALPALTGEQCSPTGFHWSYNTYSNSKVIGSAVVKNGGKTWFFLTTDYAFGTAIQTDMTKFVEAAGGTVAGSVRMPLGNTDFASFLLQAQASKAKVVGVAAGGADFVNTVKQAGEFGIADGGQALAGVVVFVQDVRALGTRLARGLYLAEPFYWDLDDKTRAFSKRFMESTKMMPNSIHAGVYSAVTHYLKAVAKAGTDEGKAVAAAMKALPVEDMFTHGAKVREDGQVLRDLHLFQVKAPDESKSEWDLYRLISTAKGEEAYRPLADGKCPHVAAK